MAAPLLTSPAGKTARPPAPAPVKRVTTAVKTTTPAKTTTAVTKTTATATKPASTADSNAAALALAQQQANAQARQQANQATAYTVEQTLESYGFSGTTLQQMVGFVNTEITEGKDAAQISLDLQQTSWFKAEFPAIDQRVKAGLPPITPAEYLSAKDAMTQSLVAAGISPTTVNLDNLIAKDVSATELSDRIQQGYLAVSMAPANVIAEMQNYYGVTAGQLVQHFTDPKISEATLLQQAAAAQIGGAAQGSGFMGANRSNQVQPVSADLAKLLAQQGVTFSQAEQGFGQLATQAQLYNNLPGQAQNRQLTANQLSEAQFFGGPVAQELQQRAQAQKNLFQQGTQVGQSGQQTAAGTLQR